MVEDGVYKIKDGVGYDVYFKGRYIGWARTAQAANEIYRNSEEAEVRRNLKQQEEVEKSQTKMADKKEDSKEEKENDNDEKDSDNPPERATGAGGSTFSPTFLLENVKKPRFWLWVFLIFAILFTAWLTNFLKSRDILSAFLNTYGFTLLGLITVIVMICFIFYGWFVPPYNLAKFYIATALFIWMIDLVPQIDLPIIRWLGSTYQGFEFPFKDVRAILSIPWLPIIGSSFTFAFLYINMIYKIIKKDITAFILSFIFIIIFNYLTNQLPTYLRFNFNIPYGKILFLLGLLILGGLALWWDKKGVPHWSYKKRAEGEIADFFTYLYMIFVLSFFWLNTGWQGNLKAWFHVFFIIAFGFGYIKPMAKIPYIWHLLIPTLLIIDFYGYGLLYNSDILALQFIPPLVIFVIVYCYEIETEKGTKNYTYPVAAFILLVTFVLLMSVSVAGTTSAEVPFVTRKGADYKDLFTQFKERFTGAIEKRLEFATGGYYRGSVEQNRYESLGVYFTNIRAADPKFYQDEPITVWGSIRSKTYKDAVIINFSCYRLKENKRIKADKIVPDIKFPIFTLEEVDTECTFLPKKEKGQEVPAGSNIITFSAEYNFGTDAYIKAYFMDRDRYRAYGRENIDPFKEFGIKDTNPIAVFTNGPVEIGMTTGQQPITVSKGYAVKPFIGITLTNRKEIQDKDKRIITRWEGKIKNITELVLLTPPGVFIPDIEKCQEKDLAKRTAECPCSMPFKPYKLLDCLASCDIHVLYPCTEVCGVSYKDNPNAKQQCSDECAVTKTNCNQECTFLFEGEGSAKEKYTGYELDVGSLEFKDLNKDIDKHRSFRCRIDTVPSQVLGNEPISTRYFRARARYNYLLENSVPVNVETLPTGVKNVVPEPLTKIAEFLQKPDIYFPGLTNELISAIASVESQFRHCCKDAAHRGGDCVESGEKDCPFERLITSGSSFGIMQVQYNTQKSKDYADSFAKKYCGENVKITNYDCNVIVGVAILSDKYRLFRNGCSKYPELTNACNNCQSNKQPYKKYKDYIGVEAAVRGYNGWGCGTNADTEYVGKVLDAMKTVKGIDIIDPTTLRSITRAGEGMSVEGTEEIIGKTEKPSPPTSVQAININPGVVAVQWTKSPSSYVESYLVARNEQGNPLMNICDYKADATQTTYTCIDNKGGLEKGKTYIYTITVYDYNGEYSDISTGVVIDK